MKFKRFINESPILSPEHTKEFKSLGSMIKYKDRYKELFKDEDRIYLPVGGSVTIEPSDLDVDLGDGIFKKLQELERKYDGIEFTFTQDFESRKITFIVRANSYTRTSIKSKEKLEYTLDEFVKFYGSVSDKDQIKHFPKIGEHKKLMVMISRNPCDIGAMSTGTYWTSCMNLYNGIYNVYTRDDVRYGTLVAYLIDSDDKNAEKPLGRKLIKPYVNYGEKLRKELLVLTKPIYGVFSNEAEKVIKKWLDEHQKDIEGYFKIHSDLYKDDNIVSVKKEKG